LTRSNTTVADASPAEAAGLSGTASSGSSSVICRRRAASNPARMPPIPYAMFSNRAPNVVPSNKNGNKSTGFIRPATTSNVPVPAINHRNVDGRVTRSIMVFLPASGRCQSMRKPTYSSRRRRKLDAAAPPKTRITGWPSR
jgi:hypothetical protein